MLLLAALTLASALDRACFDVAGARVAPPRGPRAHAHISADTAFGRALESLASLPSVRHVLEVGTGQGVGSTLLLAHALRRSAAADDCVAAGGDPPRRCCGSWVTSIELLRANWEHARAVLREQPAWCLLGTSVPLAGLLAPEEIAPMDRDEYFHRFYARDAALINGSQPQLARACGAHRYDLVLLDGGPYTAWADFTAVREACAPTLLALHDTDRHARHVDAYLRTHADEYVELVRGGSPSLRRRPDCVLVGCRTDAAFAYAPVGWVVYVRTSAAAALRRELASRLAAMHMPQVVTVPRTRHPSSAARDRAALDARAPRRSASGRSGAHPALGRSMASTG